MPRKGVSPCHSSSGIRVRPRQETPPPARAAKTGPPGARAASFGAIVALTLGEGGGLGAGVVRVILPVPVRDLRVLVAVNLDDAEVDADAVGPVAPHAQVVAEGAAGVAREAREGLFEGVTTV